MPRRLMKLACILGFLGIPACAPRLAVPAGPTGIPPREELLQRARAADELAVLFVGNSYSFGVPRAFARISAAHGKKVRVGHSTFGGWSLAKHATSEATLKKIRGGRWDIVVLQEQSEIPAMRPRAVEGKMFPPLALLVGEVRRAGAVPVLYQTWGRRDGDVKRRGDDFGKMTARLRDGYRSASAACGGAVVVPVGDEWAKVFQTGDPGGLFMEDGSHPSQKGSDLTAAVFFEALFPK